MKCDKCNKKISFFSSYCINDINSKYYNKNICKKCWDEINKKLKILNNKNKESSDHKLKSELSPIHNIIILVVLIILIIYIIIGIVGIIEILGNKILKDYLVAFSGAYLFGLIIPFCLLAIYYKLK